MTENDESLSQSCLVSVTCNGAFYDQCVWHIISFSYVREDTRFSSERDTGTKTRVIKVVTHSPEPGGDEETLPQRK